MSDNIIEGRFSGFNINGDIIRTDFLGNCIDISESDIRISHCFLNVEDIYFDGTSISIDSSFIHGSLDVRGTRHGPYEISMERCVVIISGRSYLSEAESFNLINNTFIVPDDDILALTIVNDYHEEYNIVNNIFVCEGDSCELFYLLRFRLSEFHRIRHNCIWGFDYLLGSFNRMEDYPFELDSTNILADPLLLSLNPVDPRLKWDSPCIDSGDPDSPRDPDGSRADMGAFYYRREYSAPGINEIVARDVQLISPYPNPFNSYINLSITSSGSSQLLIKLLDLTGRTISETMHNPSLTGSGIVSFDASSLASGSYYLMLRTDRYTKIVPVFCQK